MLSRALPFETIPDEPLRAHFTRWLVRSLADTVQPETTATSNGRPGRPASPETAVPPEAQQAGPLPQTAPGKSDRLPKARPAPHLHDPLSANGSPPDPRRADPPPLEWQNCPPAPPRPPFVRQRDGTVWVTKPILRSRGWTDAAVRDFLPGPEGLKPNPRFPAFGSPMPVWRPATIAAAEASPEWQAWLERSLRRRQTTPEALAETDDLDFRARLEAARAAIEAEGGTPPKTGTRA